MKRRGLQIDALKEFILLQGASRDANLMEWEKLWTLNKRIIDPVCPRHVALIKSDRVELTLCMAPNSQRSFLCPSTRSILLQA